MKIIKTLVLSLALVGGQALACGGDCDCPCCDDGVCDPDCPDCDCCDCDHDHEG